MSGASNFDQVDKYTSVNSQKAKEEDEKNKDKKLQTLTVKKPENDLDFLQEEDEWAAIYKYNRYLYEKEQQLLKEKEQAQKIKVRTDLDKQIKEKEISKLREVEEKNKYSDNVKI